MSPICYLLFSITFTAVAFGEEIISDTAVRLEAAVAVAPNLDLGPKIAAIPKITEAIVAKEASPAVPSVLPPAAQDAPLIQVAAATPEQPAGDTTLQKAESSGEGQPEAQFDVPTLQQDATENSDSLRIIPMVSALLSFGALLSFTLVFLMKIWKKKPKGQGSNSKAKPAALDELDFDDLENALGMPPSPTSSSPKPQHVRKMVQSQELEDTHMVVAQEQTDVSANGWANELESDAGWGEDAWADGSWDDATDSEVSGNHEADLAEATVAVPMHPKPAQPLQPKLAQVPRKGKAD